jgi:hypothetical protein
MRAPRQAMPKAECRVEISSRLIAAFQRAAQIESRPVAVREALRLLHEFAENRQNGIALHVVPADGRPPSQVTLRLLTDEADLYKDHLATEPFVLIGTSKDRHSRAKRALNIGSDELTVEIALALGKLLAEERSWHSAFVQVQGGRQSTFTVYFGDKPLWMRVRKTPLIGAPLSWLLQKLGPG